MLLRQLKENNQQWFARGNKKFFQDVSYRLLHSKKTGEPYLVRSTYAWTDMFDQPKRLHYRINPIGENFKIMPLVEQVFSNIYEVKEWLRNN